MTPIRADARAQEKDEQNHKGAINRSRQQYDGMSNPFSPAPGKRYNIEYLGKDAEPDNAAVLGDIVCNQPIATPISNTAKPKSPQNRNVLGEGSPT